jgi:ABC-2 type transport system permease protein
MSPWFQEFVGGIREEARSLAVRKGVFTVLLLLPVLYPLLVSSLYVRREASERPALVIDEDNSALSRKLMLHLDATTGVRVVDRPESMDRAFALLRQGRAEMLVRIPKDFSGSIKRGRQGSLNVWVSSANMYTYGVAAAGLSSTVLDLNRELGIEKLAGRGMSREQAGRRVLPIAWEDRPLFHPSASYGDFVVTGILLIVIQQIVLMSLAYSVGWQREDDVLPRSRYPFTHLSGRAALHLAFQLLGILAIAFGFFPWFGWPAKSAWAMFGLFSALALAMVPPALIVASLVKDRFVAFQLLLFFSVPLFLVSGFSWPLATMPKYVQAFAWLFPATPALQAVRVLSMKADSFASVSRFLAIMAAQWVAWSAAAFVVVRRRWRRHPPAAPAAA